MNTFLWAGLTANALAHLRIAVLQVQDGEDRVEAGEFTEKEVVCWRKGGVGFVALRTLTSPVITAYKVGKFLLFPRGIKSRFAKEQEAQAAAAERQRQQELIDDHVRELETVIKAWAPGEILLAPLEPEQVALTWDHAADAFDTFAEQVGRTKGQPWRTGFEPRIKAKVGT